MKDFGNFLYAAFGEGPSVEASMLITLARFGLYKKKKSNVDLAGWEAFLLDARDTGWK